MQQLASFESNWQVVNGKFIHYVVCGEGTKELLLVHGWNNNWRGWWQLAEMLQQHYRVVMVDLPGFGESDRLEQYDMAIEAEYLAGLIEQLDMHPTVVGLSMGSLVSAQLIAERPDLVAGAVLFGGVFRPDRKRQAAQRVVSEMMQGVNRSRRATRFTKRLVDTYSYSYLTARFVNQYRFNREVLLQTGIDGKRKVDPQAFVQMGIAATSFRMEEVLDGVRVPVHLCFGSHDKLTRVEQAQAMLARKQGNFSFVVIEEAGHTAPMEQPEQAVRVIGEFVGMGE